MYEAEYCRRCVHSEDEGGCAVLLAHMLHNYDECNNPDSILHLLIPRIKQPPWNEQCRMFHGKRDIEGARVTRVKSA